MYTKIERVITRETAAVERTRPLVVELHPHYAVIRVKGTREFHVVHWDAILSLGRRLDAREARALGLRKGA
jgi:hypothetical protein